MKSQATMVTFEEKSELRSFIVIWTLLDTLLPTSYLAVFRLILLTRASVLNSKLGISSGVDGTKTSSKYVLTRTSGANS